MIKIILTYLILIGTVFSQSYVTIPDKNATDQLTSSEFNQILDAIKDGTLSINTTSITVGGTNYTVFMLPSAMRDSINAYLGDSLGVQIQAYDATLSDIADGTIAEDLVNTANPWADNEVADNITATSYVLLTAVDDSVEANAYYAGGTDVADADVADDITLTNLSQVSDAEEAVEDYSGGMFTGNTETRCTVTYQDADGTVDVVVDDLDTDTNLSEEEVEDFVGGMLGGTETGISVTYEDASNDIDFVVSVADAQVADNITLTNLSQVSDAEEAVEDYAGGMFTGNTETGISVTYQDADGTVDFVVSVVDSSFGRVETDTLAGQTGNTIVLEDTLKVSAASLDSLTIGGEWITKIIKIGTHTAIIFTGADTMWCASDTTGF